MAKSLSTARVHQCLAPNDRMHFVAVKFVPVIGE
jgi:hypothetical protein